MEELDPRSRLSVPLVDTLVAMKNAMPRIAMSLIVRNELEFIAANIDFHAAQGVDYFVVMDNGSTDGTREKIEELKGIYDIDLFDQPATDFRQDEWATQLAHKAHELGKADYIISNDADEFWLSRTGSLKDVCGRSPVLSVPRTNMLPMAEDMEGGRPFYDCAMNVVAPLGAPRPSVDPHAILDVPIMLRTMPPKTMCALEGLNEVLRGNHDVRHEAGPPTISSNLHVYHFPVRSWDSFVEKILFARSRFAEGPSDFTSWHLRRWVAKYNLGILADEWRSFWLDHAIAADLEARGVIRRDEAVRQFFVPATSLEAPAPFT